MIIAGNTDNNIMVFYVHTYLIMTHFFRASMKFIRASGFTGSCNRQKAKERLIRVCDATKNCLTSGNMQKNSQRKVKMLTTLGFSRAERNRVKKYGLRKML